MNALRRAEESAQADIRSDLRRRRRALGLTQAQAAQLLGMSRLSHVVLSPLFPPLKKGRPSLVEVYGRLGDRVSGQASERLSEASTGSRPTWPAAAAGPVRRTLSRVGLGSIIRVIAGKRFGAKAAVCLGF